MHLRFSSSCCYQWVDATHQCDSLSPEWLANHAVLAPVWLAGVERRRSSLAAAPTCPSVAEQWRATPQRVADWPPDHAAARLPLSLRGGGGAAAELARCGSLEIHFIVSFCTYFIFQSYNIFFYALPDRSDSNLHCTSRVAAIVPRHQLKKKQI